jgi:hypothetical protein
MNKVNIEQQTPIIGQIHFVTDKVQQFHISLDNINITHAAFLLCVFFGFSL